MNFRWGKRFGLVRASLSAPSRTIIILLGFVLLGCIGTCETYFGQIDTCKAYSGQIGGKHLITTHSQVDVHRSIFSSVKKLIQFNGEGGGQNINGYYK